MSLTNAMNSATSGLLAQAKALASISSNVANSQTTGFKGTTTTFESFLNRKNTVDESVGGVRAYNYRDISAQGDIQTNSTETNLAVDGDGFFCVSTDASDGSIVYTRDGSFSANDSGYLVNEDGYYLYGWALDSSGNVEATNKSSTSSLTAINVTDIKGEPKATSAATIVANLPSDLTTTEFSNGTYTTSSDLECYDGQGASSSVKVNWSTTSGDTNTWTVSFGDSSSSNAIYSSSDSTAETGTTDGTTYTVKFDTNGKLESITNNSTGAVTDTSGDTGTADLNVTWANGSTSTVAVDLGTIGATDGLTNYASGSDTPDISNVTTAQDGHSAGTLTGVTISKAGIVTASFDNGQTEAIYEIPIATFANEDGLKSLSGSVFQQTVDSGSVSLSEAGTGKAGSITPSALESSTVELTDEFSLMITTQQAYSAASKVVSTTNDMMTTLVNLKQ